MVVNPWGTISCGIVMVAILLAGCIATADSQPEAPAAAEPSSSIEIVNESQPLAKIEIVQASAEDTEAELMYRTKGRYLGESYKIERLNVSGYKDLNLDISVYNFKFLRQYQESAEEDWGTFKWWTHKAPAGQKFLFVFIRVEMEGTDQHNDPRIWGFESSHFAAQIQNQFAPVDWTRSPCVAIKEMQDVPTFNKESRVSDYGKLRVNSLKNGAECQDLGWLRMGQSNQWDGFIIYVVPESVTEKDIIIPGSFDHLGEAWWKLTRRPA